MRRAVHFAVLACAVAAAVLAGLLATSGRASADVLDPACPGSAAQVFLPWVDPDFYVLAPDGGFEQSAAGWQLSGGAAVVAGNEPWSVSGPGSHSLALPAGSSAWTPPICVGLLHPTMRLFARANGFLGLGTLVVDAELTAAGTTVTLPVGTITAGSSFRPSLPLPLLANLVSPLSGGTGSVRLHFVAVGAGFQVDDVYIDPFKTT